MPMLSIDDVLLGQWTSTDTLVKSVEPFSVVAYNDIKLYSTTQTILKGSATLVKLMIC